MKKQILLALLCAAFTGSFAQSPSDLLKYSALGIPDSLKKDADAVLRLHEEVVEISSPSKFSRSVHKIVTLLNKDAASYLHQIYVFDKFRKFDELEVKLYSALGQEIRKVKRKDFEESYYDDQMSLHSDAKKLRAYLPVAEYPCTLEINYTIKNSGTLVLPTATFQMPSQSTEKFSLTVKVPAGLDIQHVTRNSNIKPAITEKDGIKTYQWNAANLKALRHESGGYAGWVSNGMIELAPVKFEFDGYKGEMSSWKTYGQFYFPFYEDPAPFTAARTAEIKKMVAHCTTDKEKATVLYSYLKKTMRYVGIQLGIGGIKPFPVSYVDDKKYGDCKALTHYMRYLLKAVDIPSYPALINADADEPPVDPGFIADGFNHVILCVPMQRDTVWLECTSSTNEFGELGSSTENKNALLITENGGKLVSTPRSVSKSNKLITHSVVTVGKEGDAKMQTSFACTGIFANYFLQVREMDKDEVKHFLVKWLNYKSPDSYTFNPETDSAHLQRYSAVFAYDQVYDFKAGSKYFFRPRMNEINDHELKTDAKRTRDYLFSYPYERTDTTEYLLPAGLNADVLPPLVELESPYGYYRKEVTKAEGNRIKVVTQLNIKNHIVPAKDYNAVAEFFQKVNKTDMAKLVIIGE